MLKKRAPEPDQELQKPVTKAKKVISKQSLSQDSRKSLSKLVIAEAKSAPKRQQYMFGILADHFQSSVA